MLANSQPAAPAMPAMPPPVPMRGPTPAPVAPPRPIPAANAWSPASPTPGFNDASQDTGTDVRAALAQGRPRLVVTQLDGTEFGDWPLNEGDNLVGREVGGIFADDNLLSGRHATIIVKGGAAWVRDEGSRNGVYARVLPNQRVEIHDGDQFCIGRVILRYERLPASLTTPPDPHCAGYLVLVAGRDVDKGQFPLPVPMTGLTLGRSRADLRFPNDGWISGLHCQIQPVGPQVFLVDLRSSNGTFVRIRGTRPLAHHDVLLMGQRIFHYQSQ
ncbi:MAG: FHA domain-containing protein [Polyangiales bacterium]